jgi:hypothetical protein
MTTAGVSSASISAIMSVSTALIGPSVVSDEDSMGAQPCGFLNKRRAG